ncbi:SHOCT domain-containing protein [Flavivirga jejuensis]|uniref:SHOCT domain-containing protein n=1 Tax=Flavivirga jejuensis TaxID=870487 RepID=A0ABT8WPJ0_9FLAO|nr:SHOCT domain-containing protein [Flavivirga jejuensis]MDO5975080.1 SHOCT domain-containing protein [Flavivirga jejuensis]
MQNITLVLLFLFASLVSWSQDLYKTKSGITYKIGDTLYIGQPLSNLGWLSIYETREEDYIRNKNLIDKLVIITDINLEANPVHLIFNYLNKDLKIDIDDAIRNKEVIPHVKRDLADKKKLNKYQLLKDLKDLLDSGALTQEEFNEEKKKILKH